MLFGTKEEKVQLGWTAGDFYKRLGDSSGSSDQIKIAKDYLVKAHANTEGHELYPQDLVPDFRQLSEKLNDLLKYESPDTVYNRAIWLNLRVCKSSIDAVRGGVEEDDNVVRYRRSLQRIVAISTTLLPRSCEMEVAIRFMRHGNVPVLEAWKVAKALAWNRASKDFTNAEYEDWANHLTKNIGAFNEEIFDQLSWIESRLSRSEKH